LDPVRRWVDEADNLRLPVSCPHATDLHDRPVAGQGPRHKEDETVGGLRNAFTIVVEVDDADLETLTLGGKLPGQRAFPGHPKCLLSSIPISVPPNEKTAPRKN